MNGLSLFPLSTLAGKRKHNDSALKGILSEDSLCISTGFEAVYSVTYMECIDPSNIYLCYSKDNSIYKHDFKLSSTRKIDTLQNPTCCHVYKDRLYVAHRNLNANMCFSVFNSQTLALLFSIPAKENHRCKHMVIVNDILYAFIDKDNDKHTHLQMWLLKFDENQLVLIKQVDITPIIGHQTDTQYHSMYLINNRLVFVEWYNFERLDTKLYFFGLDLDFLFTRELPYDAYYSCSNSNKIYLFIKDYKLITIS